MLTVITAPSIEPITAAEAYSHCRTDSTDASRIAFAIAGARAKCEGVLNRALITRTVEQALDEFPADEIALELRPAIAITHIKYTDTAGVEQTLDSANYTLDTRSPKPWVLPAIDTEWPETEDSINAVRIRYTAGFGSAVADIPADIRMWLLMTIGFLYINAEAMDMTGKVIDIPSRFVDSLLDPWRTYD